MSWEVIDQGGGMTVCTGEGGGRILFLNGQCKGAQSDPRHIEQQDEIAIALRIVDQGEAGYSPEDDAAAAEMLLSALRRADAGLFRRLADEIRDRKKQATALAAIEGMVDSIMAGDDSLMRSKEYADACKVLKTSASRDTNREIVLLAIGTAGREVGGVPPVEAVAEAYERIRLPEHQGIEYYCNSMNRKTIAADPLPSRNGTRRLEHLKNELEALGFGWLPRKAQGESLRRG